jgi:pyruvate/2-oxoglutarate/acetoin dehydrogenase E1 component
MSLYSEKLTEAMEWLGQQPDVFVIGQTVQWPGTALYKTLAKVPDSKKLELPIMEESQIGIALGLSLNGFFPVNIIPRYNFLLLAVNQIVNHVDKYKEISDDQYIPRMIIRTVKGSEKPLFPGEQHIGSFSEGLRLMTKNINIVDLTSAEQIVPAYQQAYFEKDKSTILVEDGDLLDK